MTFTLTREQLYDLVWSEPMRSLAKQVGISDVAIAKHCRKLGIPLPQRGYWNKLQAGKKVTKTELPERDLVTINRVSMSGTLPAMLCSRFKGEPGESSEQNENIEILAERLRKRLGKVTVPRNFSTIHSTIANLLKRDEQRKEEFEEGSSWRRPYFDDPFERRRLLFINGLFLGFEKLGGQVTLRGPEARELYVHIGNTNISFQLEKIGQGNGRRTQTDSKFPEGLCLSISHHRPPPGIMMRWQDQEGLRLEKQLTEVIIGMVVTGEHLHRQWMEERAAWQRKCREEEEHAARKRKEEEERREQERLAAIEQAKIDGLLYDAEAWQKAKNVRAYIKAAQEATNDQVNVEEFEVWSRWALTEADKLDPIVSKRVNNNRCLNKLRL